MAYLGKVQIISYPLEEQLHINKPAPECYWLCLHALVGAEMQKGWEVQPQKCRQGHQLVCGLGLPTTT